MSNYEFTIYLEDHLDSDAEGRMLARCPDVNGSGRSSGVEWVTFYRESVDLETAIRSAIADLHALGHKTGRIEMESDIMAAVQ